MAEMFLLENFIPSQTFSSFYQSIETTCNIQKMHLALVSVLWLSIDPHNGVNV